MEQAREGRERFFFLQKDEVKGDDGLAKEKEEARKRRREVRPRRRSRDGANGALKRAESG